VTGYDSALSALRGHLGELETALALWATRDDTKAQPEVRDAASDATDAIDTAIRELYGIRGQLIPEVRASDDAATARAEELLRPTREERWR
jgi:hypothetical protein